MLARLSRRRAALLVLAALLAAAGLVVWLAGGRTAPARYATTAVERGDLADVVGATGVLQAVTTVQVGSQVSGTIQSLGADFNSRVTRGQVVARLDPSLFEARVTQAQANRAVARANVERARAAIDDARQKHERARELASQSLVAQADLDAAKASHDGALAQLRASEAAVVQASAALHQAEVDLGHTVIRAPIDGVVIARNVDVGQTVAASLQAPTLFVIANDLRRMQVKASVDEADIGRVRAGQLVEFGVDAYPERRFSGRVEQVRLQPISTQNVVTYDTIISVPNDDERLMPGMTATVSLVVERHVGVLRVPAAALRFRPEGFAAETGARGTPGDSRAGRPAEARPAGSEGVAREGRRRAVESAARPGRGPDSATEHERGAAGPGGRRGLVFVPDASGLPQPRRVRLGLSDGRFVEVLDGLAEGERVITEAQGRAARPASPATGSANPFAPRGFQPRTR